MTAWTICSEWFKQRSLTHGNLGIHLAQNPYLLIYHMCQNVNLWLQLISNENFADFVGDICVNIHYISYTTIYEYIVCRMVASLSRHQCLTHRGRITHLCVNKPGHLWLDNGCRLQRQAIVRTIARLLMIRTLGISFSEIWSKIQQFSHNKIKLKILSANWRPFCLGLSPLAMATVIGFHC